MFKNVKQLYSSYNLNNIIAVFIVILLTLSFAACSKEDAPIAPEKEVVDISNGKAWSVSVSAKKVVEGLETKLLNGNSSEGSLSVEDGWEGESKENSDNTKLLYLTNSDNTLNFEWEDGAKVQVYKGSEHVGELTIDASKSNIYLKGYLYGNFSKNEELTFYTISKDRNYHNQKGTIDDIGKNYDYSVATSIIEHIDNENNELTIQPAHFKSRQSITRFIIDYGHSSPVKKLLIFGKDLVGDLISVFPENHSGGGLLQLFVALSNPLDKKVTYNFTLELEDGKVLTTYKKANLKDGKYYKATINSSAVYETIREPLTIESLEDGGTITISNPLGKEFYYTINNLNPEDMLNGTLNTSSDNPITISVNAEDRVQLYGSSFDSAYGSENAGCTIIRCDVPHYVYGNTNSLRYSSGWWTDENSEVIDTDYMFARLFYRDKELLSHPSKKIILPVMILRGDYSYSAMFMSCSKMTTPPDLPATIISEACYQFMFDGCIALEYAPDLPAISLMRLCYAAMFQSCTTLKSPPNISATVLGVNCCYRMFRYCTSLERSPELKASVLKDYCYAEMFENCVKLNIIKCWAIYNFDVATGPLENWVKNVATQGYLYVPRGMAASWMGRIGNSGLPKLWYIYTFQL